MTVPVYFETNIPSDTADGLAVQEKLVSLMEQFHYSPRDVFAMRLSLEESITNAIRHGNKFAADKRVAINCTITDTKMRVVVQDEGDGFEPESVPDHRNGVHRASQRPRAAVNEGVPEPRRIQ